MKQFLISFTIYCSVLSLFLIGCGEDKPTANSPVWPKYAKNQIVYILGEKPAMITDTPSIENDMYKYSIVTMSADGERSTANWYEYELTKYPNNTTNVVHRDTIVTEAVTKLVVNNLQDQQQWIEAEYKNTYMKILSVSTIYKTARVQGNDFNGDYVISLTRELDSVFETDNARLAADLKAGKYPKN